MKKKKRKKYIQFQWFFRFFYTQLFMKKKQKSLVISDEYKGATEIKDGGFVRYGH